MPAKYTSEQWLNAFWSRVDKSSGDDACWIWTGGLVGPTGYGGMRWNGRECRAHRVSYELAFGPFDKTLDVCHTCDCPRCVNPKHLFLGTAKDNIADCRRKGRFNQVKGERHAGHKLTDAQVTEIRRLYATGNMSQQAIADMFGVCQTHVSLIVRNKSRIG